MIRRARPGDPGTIPHQAKGPSSREDRSAAETEGGGAFAEAGGRDWPGAS